MSEGLTEIYVPGPKGDSGDVVSQPFLDASLAAQVAAVTARLAAETAQGAAEAARNYIESLVITDLGTTDGQSSALINTPASLTSLALAAEYAVPRKVRSKILANGTDQTVTLQAELNALGVQGGILLLSAGTFVFTGTVNIPNRCGIVGVDLAGGASAAGAVVYGTNLSHQPATAIPFLVFAPTTPSDYCKNNRLQFLNITGNANSTTGIDLHNPGWGVVADLRVTNFYDNIRMSQSIIFSMERVTSVTARRACFYIYSEGGTLISTTATLRECYFGQSYSAYGAGYDTTRPLIVDPACCIGVVFDRCVFESVEVGALIGSGNIITFRDLYTENVPHTSSAKAIIEIGKDVPSVVSQRGIITFVGGTIAGCNFGIHAGSSIFDVDYANSVSVVGVTVARANTTLKTTANTKAVTFIGCNDAQITNGIHTTTEVFGTPKVVQIGNFSGANNARYPDTYALRKDHQIGGTSPIGVVTANIGAQYVDQIAATGARLWIGTGFDSTAASWRVAEGDTGRRNVSSLISAGWDINIARVRRVNNTVNLIVRLTRTTTGGSDEAILTMPAGFVAQDYVKHALYSLNISGGAAHSLGGAVGHAGAGATINVYPVGGRAWVIGDMIEFSIRFETADEWPTTLPGTAA